jgi:hypothetical protein
MDQQSTELILSALEDVKAGIEWIAPFLMGDLDMRRAAANFTDSAQGQRNEMKGTKRKHKRQRGKDDSPKRFVPQNTEHDSELLCESVPEGPVMDVKGLPSLAPGEEVGDKDLETSGKKCCECHEGSLPATLDPERQQREYQEQSVQKIPAGHIPLNMVSNPELRGGVLYTNCDCTRRNGLQSDCGRFRCRGRKECLSNPPTCIHSRGIGYI